MIARAAALGLLCFTTVSLTIGKTAPANIPALASTRAPTASVVSLNSAEKAQSVELELVDGKEYRFEIRPKEIVFKNDPNNTDLYLEWLPNDANSDARVALLASHFPREPKLMFEGVQKSANRDCTKRFPCAIAADQWDDASFFTRPGYAFVRMHRLHNVTNVLLQLVADDSASRNVKGDLWIKPRRATEENNREGKHFVCGGRNGKTCDEKGTCVLQSVPSPAPLKCECFPTRGGRFCEDEVEIWSCAADSRVLDKNLKLKAGEWKYVRYKHCEEMSNLKMVAHVRPLAKVKIYWTLANMVCNTNVRIGGEDDILPSSFHKDCMATQRRFARKLIADPKHEVSIHDNWNFGLIAEEDTEVTLTMRTCGGGQNNCFHSSSLSGLPFLILPIVLCILCVAAAVVCVLLYVDRRHGLVTGPDKLSESELGRMCPEYILESLDDPAFVEDKTCSVCLCDFQVGGRLRMLKCDHRFHSECIDPWLTQSNASCPICREEARVPELSERRLQRAFIKHVLAPILHLPLRARSRRLSPFRRRWRNADSRHQSTDEPVVGYYVDEARDMAPRAPQAPSPVATSHGLHPHSIEPELIWRHVDGADDDSGDEPLPTSTNTRTQGMEVGVQLTLEEIVLQEAQQMTRTNEGSNLALLPDRIRSPAACTQPTHPESANGQQREDSELSGSTFYSAPLDFALPMFVTTEGGAEDSHLH